MAQTGFQPALGRIFYPTNSAVDAWLGDVGGDPRPHNFADRLMNELFFLVHDYLHILGYRWINGLMPELGFGTAEITEKNAESFVFCHLLTEAVATVGLDYWYLSRLNLYEELQIGTGFSGLTVCIERRTMRSIGVFDPTFEVQSTAFFERICRFYCTGEFEGFGKEDWCGARCFTIGFNTN